MWLWILLNWQMFLAAFSLLEFVDTFLDVFECFIQYDRFCELCISCAHIRPRFHPWLSK